MSAPLNSPLLQGKRLVVTGVLTEASIAFSVARLAQQLDAEVVLTSFGRAMRLTSRVAQRLPMPAEVLELDVTNPAHFDALAVELGQRWGAVDGVLHSIGFAPSACLEDDFLTVPWRDVAVAMEVSAFSLKDLVAALLPLMKNAGGGSVVGLDFDADHAWPGYNWMGVAKASLESVARYLAREVGHVGVRVNLVCAGPIRTMAASSVPGFGSFEDAWAVRAPLGWSVKDPEPVARACIALLSDLFPMTTGERVHVDGGFHAVGA